MNVIDFEKAIETFRDARCLFAECDLNDEITSKYPDFWYHIAIIREQLNNIYKELPF